MYIIILTVVIKETIFKHFSRNMNKHYHVNKQLCITQQNNYSQSKTKKF